MKKTALMTTIALTFLLGVGVGSVAAKKRGVSSALWQGQSPEQAAAGLLEIGAELAENGSWENIYLGRVYYLSGEKERGEAIFSRYTDGRKVEAGDVIRVAWVYAEAGEWEKAKPLFDRVIELAPKDEDWLVEIGAHYNLHGDREYAERLFERSFSSEPRSLKNALTAAGSYVGVPPR